MYQHGVDAALISKENENGKRRQIEDLYQEL